MRGSDGAQPFLSSDRFEAKAHELLYGLIGGKQRIIGGFLRGGIGHAFRTGTASRLAAGAEEGAALGLDDTADVGAAAWAGLVGPVVDTVVVLLFIQEPRVTALGSEIRQPGRRQIQV